MIMAAKSTTRGRGKSKAGASRRTTSPAKAPRRRNTRRSGPADGRMTAPRSGVKVRMYRQGHGDCFLLAFRGSRGKPVYVMIDCGYKPGSNGDKYGLGRWDEIVESIRAATGGRIDLFVITHEHQDHVNGLWKKTDPYFADFEIGAAWFAWTEDPNDALAKELRRRHGDQLLGIIAARNQLAAQGGDQADWLDAFLSLELGVDEPQFAAAAKDPEKSSNKQGMRLVKEKAGRENTEFILPHKDILGIPGVDGVRVFALGPPHKADLLADTDPKGSEAFPGHALGRPSSFFAAADARENAGDVASSRPFARRFSLSLQDASNHPTYGGFFGSRYLGLPVDGEGEQEDLEWRRIDQDWLYSAEELALYLNEGINNTSLVLAFELPKSGKVLLFAGDAQRGNWLSWNDGSWSDGDKTIEARDLLARTVLYKVGHHGSHNATLHGAVDDDYPNLSWMAHGKFANELVAMITAVNKWALGVKPRPWRHPLPSIKKALIEKCQSRVLQTDTLEPAPPKNPSDRDWTDFLGRVRFDKLYFELEIHDVDRGQR
jgi:beta-lactamase superfamily II metal-dependent hydrolase